MTPPNVLGTPNPASSVMMSSTLGAPVGGSTRGGQYGFDCAAFRSIVPPNLQGACGICLPSIVVVALGEPGVPVICCVSAVIGTERTDTRINSRSDIFIVASPASPAFASLVANL